MSSSGLRAGGVVYPARMRSLLRPAGVLMGRFTRSGVARPLRLALRALIGRGLYERLRLAVWVRTKEIVRVDPLHADILPLIEQLDREGHLVAGAAKRLRSVAQGIRAEVRREARASGTG